MQLDPRPRPVRISHRFEPPTRRQLLAGGAALAAGALAGPAPALGARSRTWSLNAVPERYTFADGATLPFARYQHTGVGPMRGRLPFLEATEGTPVFVWVTNTLPSPVRPALIGVAVGPQIAPGATRSFGFVMPPAGTYLFGEASGAPGTGGPVAVARQRTVRGLSAMVVSRPSSGLAELWTGGPAYDREYVLLYDDADDRNTPETPFQAAPYEPNYFTVNGMAFPDTAADADTVVAGTLGERILLRTGNAGGWKQAIHFHGYHADILARNNQPETVLPPKDTYPLPSRETVDVLLTPSQTGVFPLHPHSLTAVTAGGLYPFGQLVLVQIT